jgi:hypothetical protein
MVNSRVGSHSIVAVALCALLSLLAFLGTLILAASNGGVLACLGLAAALACPAIWLTLLLSDYRGNMVAGWAEHVRVSLQSPARRDLER